MKQWVQHKSGMGEKWEVGHLGAHQITVRQKEGVGNFYLPASEYSLCEPPESPGVWSDVTSDVLSIIGGELSIDYIDEPGPEMRLKEGYRFAWRNGLRVEKQS